MKLQEALDQCLQSQWKGTAGEVTAHHNAQCALDFFGGASSLKSVTPKLIDKYALHLADKGNGPATINRKMAALSAMLLHGVRTRVLDKMPYIRYQREPRGRVRWLTEKEERHMIDALCMRGMHEHARMIERKRAASWAW